MSADAPSNTPADIARKKALSVLFLIVVIDLLGFGVIIPALPFYAESLRASPLQVTLLFSIYSLCQMIAAPILGSLSDRRGRRPVLILSQLGSTIGYVLLAVVTAREWPVPAAALALVYLSRVIDGLSAGNISAAQAYVADVYPPERRAAGLGMLGAAFGIGFALGPALGGLLGGHGRAWYPPALAAVLSLTAAVLVFAILPEPERHAPSAPRRPGLRGLIGLPELSDIAPDRASRRTVAGLLTVAALAMGAFVMMESTFALLLELPRTFAYGVKEVGYLFGLAGLVIIIVQGGLVGRLSRRFGEWRLATLGPLLVGVGMACFTASYFYPTVILLIVGIIFNAAGRSLTGPTTASLLSRIVPPDRQGQAFGAQQGLLAIARIVGPVIAGWTFVHHPTAPYVLSLGVMIVVSAITLGLARDAARPAPRGFPVTPVEPAADLPLQQ